MDQSFQDRIERINSKRAPAGEKVLVGEDAERFAKGLDLSLPGSSALSPGQSAIGLYAKEREATNRAALEPLFLVGAFLIGAVAVVLGRFFQGGFLAGHYFDQTLGLEAVMLFELVASLAIAGLAAMIFGFRGLERWGPMALGVALALVTTHNMVHVAPDMVETVFGEPYAAFVLETTQPQTLNAFGHSVSLASGDARSLSVDASPSGTNTDLPGLTIPPY
ncbi:MAG: hypothetical protein AAFX00_01270 [Pseudomonadota bacterium]